MCCNSPREWKVFARWSIHADRRNFTFLAITSIYTRSAVAWEYKAPCILVAAPPMMTVTALYTPGRHKEGKGATIALYQTYIHILFLLGFHGMIHRVAIVVLLTRHT